MRQLYFGIVRLRDQMREAGVLMNAVLDREGAVCWHQLRGQLRQDMRLKDHEYSILEFKSEMLEKAFWLACKMMFGPYGDGMVGVTSDWKLVRKGVECSHESGSPSGLHEGLIKALQLAMLNGSSRVLVSDEGFVELPEPVVGRSNKVAESGLFRPKDGPASC